MRRLTRHLRPALSRPADEGVAMFLVIMAILVATSLSVLIVGLVLAQATPTAFARKDAQTLGAAESGLDAGLARIRAATKTQKISGTNTTVGDRTKLPCDRSGVGTLSGGVGATTDSLAFSVAIRYYSADPSNQTETWRTANKIACIDGASQGIVTNPAFALLQSTGSSSSVGHLAASAGNRTVETVYDFSTDNTNVSGGLIRAYKDGGSTTLDLCFDAGSASPAEGTLLTMQTCASGLAQQTFSWRSDYSIVVSGTQGSTLNAGMCLTSSTSSSYTPYVYLSTCAGGYDQKFGYSDGGNFFNRPGYSGTTTVYYLVEATENTVGSKVKAVTSVSGYASRAKQFRPDANVGAGSVGNSGETQTSVQDKQLQWVNYEEFGRCLDITQWEIDTTAMILYPCKQDPAGGVGWNQTFVWEASTSMIYTYAKDKSTTFDQAKAAGGSKYCLTAPSYSGGKVTMSLCDTSVDRQRWTVQRNTDDYATNYTVLDSTGRCLDSRFAKSSAAYSNPITTTCIPGDGGQKWNAPPNAITASNHDMQENTGTS